MCIKSPVLLNTSQAQTGRTFSQLSSFFSLNPVCIQPTEFIQLELIELHAPELTLCLIISYLTSASIQSDGRHARRPKISKMAPPQTVPSSPATRPRSETSGPPPARATTGRGRAARISGQGSLKIDFYPDIRGGGEEKNPSLHACDFQCNVLYLLTLLGAQFARPLRLVANPFSRSKIVHFCHITYVTASAAKLAWGISRLILTV